MFVSKRPTPIDGETRNGKTMALLWILTGVLAVAIVLDEAGH